MEDEPASGRPLMTKRSCTPPSGVVLREPLLLRRNLKRASRTGPSGVMKLGSVLVLLANWISGFLPMKGKALMLGLVPPTLGWAWQLGHWLVLKRGPRPLFTPPCTTSTAVKRLKPLLKKSVAPGVSAREARG